MRLTGIWTDYNPPNYTALALGESDTVSIVASPDFSASKLKAFLSTAEKSVDVHIYQITDESWFLFCGMKTASLFF